jgi:hypothetical protein
MRVYVIGRHTAAGLPQEYEVIGGEAVNFSLNRHDALSQYLEQKNKALAAGAEALVLQNVPGILAAALMLLVDGDWGLSSGKLRVGVIVSKPGPRLANVVNVFNFLSEEDARAAAKAVAFANARAKIQIEQSLIPAPEGPDYADQQTGWNVKVTVDPVVAFEFDHIEWM